ncbi:helix-turn-helix transcriptional regulator [Burkholderia ambifaria]|jgi:LuxR family quorum-sensing transcriptional regulator LasR|uniref:helix-turn-helix transcriptional regulator n=1 Tax=Burkholderia ambifaria TaxID=152480 RepID=UPI000CFF1A8D|nr:LuxR family transcriptional regulator [Burkholderia ambifaria]PRG00281.1 LuxR family transcriptional regulator [Burkholderia ambifaria]QQJ96435.1 autoinducer binding domain-containing protein [Burkholderia ambifaria]
MNSKWNIEPRLGGFSLPLEDSARRMYLAELAGDMGLEITTYIGPFKYSGGDPAPLIFSNGPQSWINRYAECEYFRRDPLVRYARKNAVPISWDRSICESDEEVVVVEEGEKFGLRGGLVFPTFSATYCSGVLIFSSSAFSMLEFDAPSLFAKGLLIATLIQRGVEDLFAEADQSIRPSLTRRELECLKWIAAGKSSWEISHIIGISEHGVQYHIRNVMAKYGVRSRHLAVRRAMEDGQIEWASR